MHPHAYTNKKKSQIIIVQYINLYRYFVCISSGKKCRTYNNIQSSSEKRKNGNIVACCIVWSKRSRGARDLCRICEYTFLSVDGHYKNKQINMRHTQECVKIKSTSKNAIIQEPPPPLLRQTHMCVCVDAQERNQRMRACVCEWCYSTDERI